MVALPVRLLRARLLSMVAALVTLAAVGFVLEWLTRSESWAVTFSALVLVAGLVVWWRLPQWSYLAAQLWAVLIVAGLAYLAFTVEQAALDPLGRRVWLGTLLLLLLELTAFLLALSYAFELMDALSRRDRPRAAFDPSHQPAVALQVPAYNEPIEVVERTLRSLAQLRYPRLMIQVVDNNTEDPAVWKPLEELCQKLGQGFHFMHLERWPGFKAGALNEATRRLPAEIEILGIIDADYTVRDGFLQATIPFFCDPAVAFVQTPQHYRDWSDSGYLRGLFHSYRYFFDVTMPARAHRNAIIFAGTMGLIRRSALEEIGGWNIETVTEDAEASLRMLGRGYRGVYVPEAWGEGLMPLTFDGLKKQRFRWALGGIQILRLHWRELIPGLPHRLHLTVGQRIHYLLGSVQWFGDVLNLAFTTLLIATAIVTGFHERLPVRQVVGPLVVMPLVFLITGVGRAAWGIRATGKCSWGDAVRALAIWFALSWIVALACVQGLIRLQAVFLRTPKRREGEGTVLQALRACRAELTLSALAAVGAIGVIVRAPSLATGVIAALLLWQAAVYASAPWASIAAENVTLTPLRKAYRQSTQGTGDWARNASGYGYALGAVATPVAIIALLSMLATPSQPALQTPQLFFPAPAQATPRPSPTVSPSPIPSSTPGPTANPGPKPTPTAAPSTPTPAANASANPALARPSTTP